MRASAESPAGRVRLPEVFHALVLAAAAIHYFGRRIRRASPAVGATSGV